MFVEGLEALRAVDAYNGRNLWEFALPGVQKAHDADHLSGTAVTGSNFCVAGGSVFVHDKARCYRLDAGTGRKLGEFPAPKQHDGQPGTWGYIASDGERLFGSLANPKHQVRFAYVRADTSELLGESSTVFALDARSGEAVIELLLGEARKAGATFLAVTHDPSLIESCAIVLRLDHGRLERQR